jgi:hypothetical protein
MFTLVSFRDEAEPVGLGLTTYVVPKQFNKPSVACSFTNLDDFTKNIKDTTTIETKAHSMTIQCPPGNTVNVTFTYSMNNIPDLSSFTMVGNIGPANGTQTNITFVFGSSSSPKNYIVSMGYLSFSSVNLLLQNSPKSFSDDGATATVSIIWDPSDSPIQISTPFWKYEAGLPLNVIIGIAAGGGVLFIAIVTIICIVVIRKRLDKRMKRKSLGQ